MSEYNRIAVQLLPRFCIVNNSEQPQAVSRGTCYRGYHEARPTGKASSGIDLGGTCIPIEHTFGGVYLSCICLPREYCGPIKLYTSPRRR